MIKLKQILLEIMLPPKEFMIDPEGIIINVGGKDNDINYHGEVLIKIDKYKKYAEEAIERGIFKDEHDILINAIHGSDKIYKFMFEKNFVRGIYKILFKKLILNFQKLTENQKDAIMELIAKNKGEVELISVDKDMKLIDYTISEFMDLFL